LAPVFGVGIAGDGFGGAARFGDFPILALHLELFVKVID
jgi:hypothetical protein